MNTEAIEKSLEKITPWPWEAIDCPDHPIQGNVDFKSKADGELVFCAEPWAGNRKNDAAFIASAPQTISDLLSALKAAEERAEGLAKENARLKLNLKARTQDVCDVVAYLAEQNITNLMNYMDHHNKNNKALKEKQ